MGGIFTTDGKSTVIFLLALLAGCFCAIYVTVKYIQQDRLEQCLYCCHSQTQAKLNEEAVAQQDAEEEAKERAEKRPPGSQSRKQPRFSSGNPLSKQTRGAKQSQRDTPMNVRTAMSTRGRKESTHIEHQVNKVKRDKRRLSGQFDVTNETEKMIV